MAATAVLAPVSLIAAGPNPTAVHLSTIIATSASPITFAITLHNRTSAPLRVHLTLSANLRPSLSLATYHTAPPPQPSPAASANLNLLHRATVPTLPLTLAPHAATVHTIHIVPSPAARAHASLTTLAPISGRLLLHLPPRRSAVSSLKLSANLALSRLLVSPPALPFGHVPARVHSTLPLTVRNASPAPTSFLLSSSSAHISFLHARKRTPLPRAAIRVPPFAARRILCALRPHSPGSLAAALAVEDVHNPHATLHVPVTAVAAPPVAGAFEVDCGPELHFGDCYSSRSVYKDINVTSKASHRITLSFASDRRQQVTFELLPQWSLHSDRAQGIRDRDPLPAMPWRDDLVRAEAETPISPSNRAFSGALQLHTDESPGNSFGVGKGSASSSSTQQHPTTSAEAVDVGSGHLVTAASKTRLAEHVGLSPGEKRTVRVWFLPLVVPAQEDALQPSSGLDRGRLCPDSFQIIFKLSSEESRVVEGKARVCQSILRLERSEVHLGNCDVLTQYTSSLSIINCSDLRASATIDYVSQSVVADIHEVTIQPREAFDVELTFVPRQVNPNYHKEISVTNERNPEHPSLVFTLRANCIDGQGVSLHALFYKILAPNQTNEIDFGVSVANHTAYRAFVVRNITQGRLKLMFTGAQGVKTYVSTQRSQRPDKPTGEGEKRETFSSFPNDNIEEQASSPVTKLNPCGVEALRTVNAIVEDYICSKGFRALHLKRRVGFGGDEICALKGTEAGSFGEVVHINSFERSDKQNGKTGRTEATNNAASWESFLTQLTERDYAMLDSMPMFFSNYASEMSYSDRQFRPARRLQAALQDGYLEDTGVVTLGGGAEQLVLVAMTLYDKDVKGKTKTRPIEKELTIRMLEFDPARFSVAAPTNSKEVNRMAKLFKVDGGSMPRALILTMRACKSRMKIAPLSQVNFGRIGRGEQKDKTFSIVNLSGAPLLYEIRKANKKSSEQLRFNLGKDTRGVVRPYFSKTVPFIYTPMLEGMFEEKIVVENRLDRSASCELVVKATVGKTGG